MQSRYVYKSSEAITTKNFFERLIFLFILLSLYQGIYLMAVVKSDATDFLVLMLIISISGIGLWGIKSRVGQYGFWPSENIRLFKFMYIVSFLATLYFSRYSYILTFISDGLYAARHSDSIHGGWYSVVTIFFYPLSIMLAFIDVPRKEYHRYLILMLIVVFIDFLILGTRGAPLFVLTFHVLMSRIKFRPTSVVVFIFIATVFMTVLFHYQTGERSLHTDWYLTLQSSWIFDNLPVKKSILNTIRESSEYISAFIYFSQYITHSIAEFANLIKSDIYSGIGNLLYLNDQICLLARCERSGIQQAIFAENPRLGLFQTLYSSMLFDFGYLGMGVLILSFVSIFTFIPGNAISGALGVYLAVVLAFSGIENFLYNALGFGRFLIFLFLWFLFSHKFVLADKFSSQQG